MKLLLERLLIVRDDRPEKTVYVDMTAAVSQGGGVYLLSEDEKFLINLSHQEINTLAAMIGLNIRR